MKNNIYSLIQRKINNKVVIFFFELLSKLQFPINSISKGNLISNMENMNRHMASILKQGGYIEDQNNYNDIRYGKTLFCDTGCEIIATYNAIHSLTDNNDISLAEMISSFERKGIVLSGKFGSSPKSILSYLLKNNYLCSFTTLESEFDKLAESSTSMILTFYNDRTDIRKQVHTVCITKSKLLYTAHNVYGNGKPTDTFSSVSDLLGSINNGHSKGISLIGINNY